ncbi:hypothetical protein HDF16_000106 [Granulicella aggregans]|uniref:Uncharacterized protein n=1 Tax=Granulicella aggregans TaxID=474949 RepID=A0A7W7Z943_9BACT|nr:hypothetical protein [Granulicella aggregans]MBB5055437.1 hypothetical protein [Granulicella aggregans]
MARAALAPGGGTSAAPVLPNVKPAWEEDVGRYDADKVFRKRIEGTISSGGHALRPEIRSLLNGAQKDVQTGSYAIQTLDTSPCRER